MPVLVLSDKDNCPVDGIEGYKKNWNQKLPNSLNMKSWKRTQLIFTISYDFWFFEQHKQQKSSKCESTWHHNRKQAKTMSLTKSENKFVSIAQDFPKNKGKWSALARSRSNIRDVYWGLVSEFFLSQLSQVDLKQYWGHISKSNHEWNNLLWNKWRKVFNLTVEAISANFW